MEQRNPACDLCLSDSCVNEKKQFICCNPLCARRGEEIVLTEFEEMRMTLLKWYKNNPRSSSWRLLIRSMVLVMDEVLDLKREVRR